MTCKGLKLLLGVSSSIAAYRALDIASNVVKGGGEVRAVLTPDTTRLVGPPAFDAITGRRTIVSLWDDGHSGEMDHLAATKWANVFAVAPATAATLARLATGLADDALSTLAVAWPRPLVIAPAMNPTMYQHAAVQENLSKLRARGHCIVEPAVGPTACGDVGRGRLAEVNDILAAIMGELRGRAQLPDLSAHHVLVTSGPTREFADPVRCITNPSTGRMGVAVARQALAAGARVTLVTGPCELAMPGGLTNIVRVTTAEEMKEAVLRHLPEASIAVFAAAVSDWRPAEASAQKAKKESGPEEMTLRLVRTPDVAVAAARARKPGQVFVGFAAETDDLVKNAREKMHRKSFDLIVANPVAVPGAGFGSDTNQATLLGRNGAREIAKTTKDLLAVEILAEAAKLAAV